MLKNYLNKRKQKKQNGMEIINSATKNQQSLNKAQWFKVKNITHSFIYTRARTRAELKPELELN